MVPPGKPAPKPAFEAQLVSNARITNIADIPFDKFMT